MRTTLSIAWLELRPMVAILVALMAITTVLYPLAVTGIAQGMFHEKANGSIVEADGRPAGSALVGQHFTGDEYFHGRPSAAGDGYDAAASGASNLGPTSADLHARMRAEADAYRAANGPAAGAPLPSDAITASASGLDPHISPANARLQAARVARARGVDEAEVLDLVEAAIEHPALGFIGAERVNVLKLNLALDERFPVGE